MDNIGGIINKLINYTPFFDENIYIQELTSVPEYVSTYKFDSSFNIFIVTVQEIFV